MDSSGGQLLYSSFFQDRDYLWSHCILQITSTKSPEKKGGLGEKNCILQLNMAEEEVIFV